MRVVEEREWAENYENSRHSYDDDRREDEDERDRYDRDRRSDDRLSSAYDNDEACNISPLSYS